MPIPINPRIPIKLSDEKDPSKVTAENLKQELTNIGLTCPDTDIEKLESYIQDVLQQLPSTGKARFFAITKPVHTNASEIRDGDGREINEPRHIIVSKGTLSPLQTNVVIGDDLGGWEPGAFTYHAELTTIVCEYEKLCDKAPGFQNRSHRHKQEKSGRYENVKVIKDMFTSTGLGLSTLVFEGLKKDDVEAALVNVISEVPTSAVHYDSTEDRFFCWGLNYDPVEQTVDALGVIHIDWNLKIDDYKEKKHSTEYNAKLSMTMTSVVYDDVATLESDYAGALAK